jgi:putative PIN family toxin of toxin-antitoxin system
MIVTIDTNVLLAALISNQGASHFILQLVLEEKLNLAISTQVLLESDDVLRRPEVKSLHGLNDSEIDDLLDTLVLLAKKYAVYFRIRPNLIDEGDNLIFECAFTSSSDYLITSNVKDFQGAEWKGVRFKVLTPSDFCKEWRSQYE